MASRKLRQYFQSHPITVLTDQPLKEVLQKMTTSGRMVKWSIELSKYGLEFRPRKSIKAQALADFMAECTFQNQPKDEQQSGATNLKKQKDKQTSGQYILTGRQHKKG